MAIAACAIMSVRAKVFSANASSRAVTPLCGIAVPTATTRDFAWTRMRDATTRLCARCPSIEVKRIVVCRKPLEPFCSRRVVFFASSADVCVTVRGAIREQIFCVQVTTRSTCTIPSTGSAASRLGRTMSFLTKLQMRICYCALNRCCRRFCFDDFVIDEHNEGHGGPRNIFPSGSRRSHTRRNKRRIGDQRGD